MSGYMTAQGLLKTLIQTCPSFPAGSVVEGNYPVIDTGGDNFCVLVPGAVPEYDTTGMAGQHTWQCLADLFKRRVDFTVYGAFGTLRDAVIATIDAAPCLSATYFVTAIQGDEPEETDVFVFQRLRITIQEQY